MRELTAVSRSGMNTLEGFTAVSRSGMNTLEGFTALSKSGTRTLVYRSFNVKL